MPLEVSGTDRANITLPLAPGARATFKVQPRRDGGGACAGPLNLSLLSQEDWGVDLGRSLKAVAGAPLVLESLAPTRYIVAAGKLSDSCYLASDVAFEPGPVDPVEIPVSPAGGIRGRVLDSVGSPASWTVVLWEIGRIGTPLAVTPEASGAFQFQNVSPGRYGVALREAQARWLAPAGSVMEVEVAGGATAEIDLAAPAKEQP